MGRACPACHGEGDIIMAEYNYSTCGAGLLEPALAERIYSLTRDVSEKVIEIVADV